MTEKNTETKNLSTRLPMSSVDFTESFIEQLRELAPQIFSEGQLNFEKFRAVIGEQADDQPERYGLNWAGKRNAFRNVQIPSVASLRPQFEESVNWDSTENLIIEGDNLEVLKLLQKPYHGKVKMIYIDPPYNTGNEFIYPDNFREGLDEYLRYTGQLSADGVATSTNKDTSGRYHSNWLNMMYPRLFLARTLLREDGVLFASIDDHEAHNLRLLLDEIFGEENFIGAIAWEKIYTTKNDDSHLSSSHEYALCYARNLNVSELGLLSRSEEMDARYRNIDDDPRGPWKAIPLYADGERRNGRYKITAPGGAEYEPRQNMHWRYRQEDVADLIKDNRIYFGKDGNSQPNLKRFLSEVTKGVKARTLWSHDEVGSNDSAKREAKQIFGDVVPFAYPKPSSYIRRMIQLATGPTNSDEPTIVLDFFAGSGTTAHAVVDQNEEDGANRKFILVQLPEKTENSDYPTIAHITRERVRRVIKKKEEVSGSELNFHKSAQSDLGFRAFKLDASNFKTWMSDESPAKKRELAEQLSLYAENIVPNRTDEDRLFEIILKCGLPLSSKVDVIDLGKRKGYSIAGGTLVIFLENHIDKETLRNLFIPDRGTQREAPQMVICLDIAFDGNDSLKTNAVLEAQTHGVTFKTV